MALRDLLDYCMQNEGKLKRAIEEKKLDPGPKPKSGGRGSRISNPTEAQALRNLQPVGPVLIDYFMTVDEPERMLKTVRAVRAYFNTKPQGKMYRVHYLLRCGYIATCDRLNISKSTYYNYQNAILDYAEQVWEVTK